MEKDISHSTTVAAMVESIIGCKWSLSVLGQIRHGNQRPGELERSIQGLSKKVLNERLRKLQHFGLIDKRSYAEIPPRVEYSITPLGQHFGHLLDDIEQLQSKLDQGRLSD